MPFFEYVAADNASNLKRGEMEAVDKESVIDYLRRENLLVVKVAEKSSSFGGKVFKRRISYVDKINFAGNLSTMIHSGVNLTKALDVIGQESNNPYFNLILTDLKFGIENGKPLSEGLSHYPNDFNEIFINMVKAGEASGKLEESLERLNLQLKKEYALISKVKGALIYPAVLIGGVLGVLVLIITFVIPKLVTIFSGTNLKIPLTTKILFFLARVASYKPVLTMAVLVIIVGLIVYIFRLKATKVLFNRILSHLPISATLFKQIEIVRFCRTTSGLLSSGIAIGKTLEIVSQSMGLPVYKKIISASQERILKGVSLANAFRGSEKYFPALLISVISVGEKTGELDKLLGGLADFYEEQADNSLKTLTSLIEPVLLVIVGFLIGGMAISIVVPIYQLIGTI